MEGRVFYWERRDFLKFAVGAAVGVNVSPLPWWLTNDLALWTQNWRWRPVPEKGPVSHMNSTCKLCPGGCGIRVRLIGDLPVYIEGNPLHPVNRGGLCPLGSSGLQFLYSSSRITAPLKRVGGRGEGSWQEVTWEQALDEVVKNLKDLRANGKSHTIVCISGQRHDTMSMLLERFLKAYGSPNYIHMPSIEDSYDLTLNLMQGAEGGIGFDLENARYILSFGCNLIEGWGAPVRMMLAHNAWKAQRLGRRPKVVQVESRSSLTASKADERIPGYPGTDGALALGIAHVIISERLYDHGFVEKHSDRFDKFKALVLKEYGPDRVSKITHIPKETIVRIAREFATTKPAIALWGRGKGSMPSGLYESMAVQSLNALVGNINKPGGILTQKRVPMAAWPDLKMDGATELGLAHSRIDDTGVLNHRVHHRLHRMVTNVKEGSDYPINTLFVYQANPCFSTPDNPSFVEAVKKIGFVVSFSSHMDETASQSDLILPNHSYLERWDDVLTPVGLQYPVVGITRPVVRPVFNTKHTGDVVLNIAAALGGSVAASLPWESFEELLKERVKGLFDSGKGTVPQRAPVEPWKTLKREAPSLRYASFDEMWDDMVDKGPWYNQVYEFGRWDQVFNTPTRKFEFVSAELERQRPDAEERQLMPHYEPILKGEETEYPVILVPYESMIISDGAFGNPPYMTKLINDTVLKENDLLVEISPKTAAEYGLNEGDFIEIQSVKGNLRVRVHLFEGAMPGVIYMATGLGHTAYDEYLKDKGVNPNQIIAVAQEPVSGLALSWGTRVKITKV